MNRPIVITPGDPAGIGPDILLKLVSQHVAMPIVAIADKQMLAQRAMQLGYAIQFIDYHPELSFPLPTKTLAVQHVAMPNPCVAGEPTLENGKYILNTIEIATKECLAKKFTALVTGPVNKKIINDAGFTFSGHTELLTKITNAPKSVMLLQGRGLNVALLTTHLPIRKVAEAVTYANLQNCIRIIYRDFKQRYHIQRPKILVCGLNPHAGDGGHIGLEEQEIMIPALDDLRKQGFDLTGPVSADTAFSSTNMQQFDVFLAMFHDQGLPVLKHHSFGEAVNVTLGLPIIRTSVDHGTAYDLAGTGKASVKSLHEAILLAEKLAANNHQNTATKDQDFKGNNIVTI